MLLTEQRMAEAASGATEAGMAGEQPMALVEALLFPSAPHRETIPRVDSLHSDHGWLEEEEEKHDRHRWKGQAGNRRG